MTSDDIRNMTYDQRKKHLSCLMNDVSEMHMMCIGLNRNPSITIHAQRSVDNTPTSLYASQPEPYLSSGTTLSATTGHFIRVLEQVHAFLNTVNDINTETETTARHGLIQSLQEGGKNGWPC